MATGPKKSKPISTLFLSKPLPSRNFDSLLLTAFFGQPSPGGEGLSHYLPQSFTSLRHPTGKERSSEKKQSTREGSDWSISGYVSSPGPIIVARVWSTMIGSTWSHGPVLWLVIDGFLQNHWLGLGRCSPQEWERDVLDDRRVCDHPTPTPPHLVQRGDKNRFYFSPCQRTFGSSLLFFLWGGATGMVPSCTPTHTHGGRQRPQSPALCHPVLLPRR